VSPVKGARDFLLSVAGEGLPSSVLPSPGRERLIVWMAVSEGDLWEERVVATMPVHGPTKQPYGVLHGGATVVLA
jgi:hypothetical protein